MSLLSIALQFATISRYSSRRQGVTSQNYRKILEPLTFTMSRVFNVLEIGGSIQMPGVQSSAHILFERPGKSGEGLQARVFTQSKIPPGFGRSGHVQNA